jgi:hypothetical protein
MAALAPSVSDKPEGMPLHFMYKNPKIHGNFVRKLSVICQSMVKQFTACERIVKPEAKINRDLTITHEKDINCNSLSCYIPADIDADFAGIC